MEKRLTMILACLFLSIGMAFAQTKVTGTVLSQDDGQPVIGASVIVQGTKTGTTTNIDGQFTLNVPKGKKIQVSYIGMVTQTVTPKPNMKITLQNDANTLQDVVVTGMQKMDKRLFTGASAKIDAESTKLDGVADVSRALEGRVAGVSIQNVSGTFGTAPKIRVRGATSIYGNSTPLWVVDGVILEDAVEVSADDLSSGDAVTLISNAIAGLNADDIESFQVLKDGSATSIYGARAMAGVVVITTKRGTAGRSTVNYTGEFTYRLKPSYSNYNISNSQEQMGIYQEMEKKGWLEFSQLANGSTSGLYGKMYTLIANYNESEGKFGLPYTEAAMNAYLQTAEFRNTDWFDLLFNNNLVQQHSVSISTGSEKANLYASLSMMDDPGWSRQSDIQRYTANVNATFNLSKNLSVSLFTNASYRDQRSPGTLNQELNSVSGEVSRSFDINPFSYALNTSRTLDPNETYTRNYAPFNIFKELDSNYIDTDVKEMKFHAEALWKPIQGLEFKAMGAYRVYGSSQEHYILNNANQAEAYRAGVDNPNIQNSNPYLYKDPSKPNSLPISVMPTGGIYTRTDFTMNQLNFRATGQYNKIWNDEMHTINVFGGMEVNKIERESIFHSDYGVDYNNRRIVTITPEFYKQAKEEGTVLSSFAKTWTRNLAYFGSINYTFKRRYNINYTLRYEGTNKLGRSTSARWLPTWNVGGSWNVYEEGFFKRLMENTNEAFSHLSLRASYSLTADSGPSFVTNALAVYNANNIWRPQGDQTEIGINLDANANKQLTYEKKHELNIGFDAGFLRNRINLNFDMFWRQNFDLIGITPTQGVDGEVQKYGNVADMKSHGVEVTLSTRNIATPSFTWNSDLTFSYAKETITNLLSRANVMNLCYGVGSQPFREGYPRSALFSIPFVGLNDEGIPQFINEKGEITTTDINMQEYENVDFLKYEGPTDPTITGGLNNSIKWKNWNLNIFFTYAFGNKIRLDKVFSAAYSDMSAMPKEFKNRWVKPGDEKITTIPTIASRRQYKDDSNLSYAYSAYNYSTERVADGGFIRLKNISLAYNIPAAFVHKLGLTTASLKLDATNLWLLYADDKLNGQDPEFVNAGGVAQPMSKQFTFTVRLGI